jgi:cytochrome c-type biogenesis protein CcmH/NrfG
MERKFCVNCGAKLPSGARFCVECGEAAGGARPRSAPRLRIERHAPLLVFGAVLAVAGAAVYHGARSAPEPVTIVPPSGAGGGTAALPEGHPPISLPDDVRQAIDRLAEAVKSRPQDLDAWKQLAFAQYRAGQVEASYLGAAGQSYAHVLELSADDLDALRALGNIAFDQNDPEKAIGYYDRYLALKPDDLSVRTDLGTMYLASRDVEEATRIYQAVLGTDPHFFQAQFNLAIAYRAAGDEQRAMAALERARGLANDDPSRQRVEALQAHLGADPSLPATGGAQASMRSEVESIFRTHPIAGPKVERFAWTGDGAVQVILRDFPMEGMPPEVRQRFADRIETGLREKKERFGRSDALQVQLVDSTTGRVMETITQ